MSSFLNKDEIEKIGFKSVGQNVLISRFTSIYNAQEMVLGNNIRIDDFCILSGKIQIDNFVHIAAFNALYGGREGIYISNYSTISSHSSIYSVSDDYSGASMTNPMIPDEYRNVINEKVLIKEHVIVGSHSVILPGGIIEEGCAVGAMSLVKGVLDEWGMYAGVPCRRIKERVRTLKLKQNEFEEMLGKL